MGHFSLCLAMTPLSQDLAANFSLKPAKLLLGMRWRNKYAWTQLKLVVAHALLTCIRLASRVCKSRGSKTAVSLTMQKPSSCLEYQAPPRLRLFAGTLMRKIVSSDGWRRTMVTKLGRRIQTPVRHSRSPSARRFQKPQFLLLTSIWQSRFQTEYAVMLWGMTATQSTREFQDHKRSQHGKKCVHYRTTEKTASTSKKVIYHFGTELLNINISLSIQYQLFCISSYQYQYQYQLFQRGLININILSIIWNFTYQFQYQYQYIAIDPIINIHINIKAF